MAKILSITSEVAFGHVGAQASTFALNRLGHEVCLIPTVQFSNHPGHQGYQGGPVAPRRMAELLDGMLERGLLDDCAAIHSGYLGSRAAADLVLKAGRALPNAIYCCDPVMGDDGEAYLPTEVIEALRQQLVPRADLITPNAFELSLLSGRAVHDLFDAAAAAVQVLDMGPSLVLCTSAHVEDGRIATIAVTAEGGFVAWSPYLAETPHGAGDAFAALFLGRYLELGEVQGALELTVASLQGLLEAGRPGDTKDIAIIAGQDEITSPSLNVQVEAI